MENFSVEAWQVWLGAGLLLAIAEVLGTQFVLLALGTAFSLTALVTAVFGLDFDAQLLAAALWTALLVPAFIMFYRRRMMPGVTRTLVSDGLGIGENHTVIRRGERLGVKIHGDFFPVEAIDGNVAEGDSATIIEWRGISAIVRRA